MAFPNAYVSTDELPRRSVAKRVLCAAAAVGVGYLGLVVLVLSLGSGVYDPVAQAAGDYGVGPYALEMNAGFLAAGVGVISLAAVMVLSERSRVVKAGGALFVPAGLALAVDAFYQADVGGPRRPSTAPSMGSAASPSSSQLLRRSC